MASRPSISPLAEYMSSALTSNLNLSLYHLSTPPVKTNPLFSAPPGKKAPTTTLESHFLAVSHDSVLIFAIEVLVYVTVRTGERTFFISKADSSGYLPSSASSFICPETGARKSTLRTVATAFIHYLFKGFREADPKAKATISLFARSQTQYLFPDSASNTAKHVLTDRGLIAWWCKVLDPILQEYTAEATEKAKAYCLVPGFDRSETRAMFPKEISGKAKWIDGHPMKISPAKDITVREVIPHFPDDPKARFLDELNGDEVDGKKGGKRAQGWKNVKTVGQFWELMSFRQECSLGRCVGFLWVVVQGQENMKIDTIEEDSKDLERRPLPVLSPLDIAQGTPEPFFDTPKAATPLSTTFAEPPLLSREQTPASQPTPSSSFTSPKKRASPSSPGPSSPRKKRRGSTPTIQPQKPPVVNPAMILDEKAYQRTIDSLLYHTDFGDLEKAKTSGRKWLKGVLLGLKGKFQGEVRDEWDWGETITGKLAVAENKPEENQSLAETINVLAVRKKPKSDEGTEKKDVGVVKVLGAGLVIKKLKADEGRKESVEEGVKVLGAGLIRKKPKAEEEKKESVDGVVNILSLGLVRKKPKPVKD
ncbi:hypothetical protein RUND412_000392 [Rhizina undulata]